MAAVRAAAPAPHDPFVDLIPGEGVQLTPRHYAYLKISEGCDHRCTFCIIPKLRGELASRPAGDVLREAERLVKAGVKELLVIAQDTSAYGLDLKYAASQWRDREDAARFLDITREIGDIRRLGQAAICLPLSACRRGDRADERRQGAALSRRAVPARFACGAEGDAPAGQPGKDARAHPRLARDLPGSDHPLDFHRRLSRRDRGGFRAFCSTGSTRRSSTASAPSNTSPSRARAPTISASSPCRTRSRRAGTSDSCSAPRRSATGNSPPRSASASKSSSTRAAPRGEGPQQGRRAADRRRRAYRDPPAAARRRHRDGQDRPLRRL